jgi:hypothetical protein
MPRTDLREAYLEILKDQVRACRYPSPTMMDRLEAACRDIGAADEYVRLVMDLMANEKYPSPEMLDRVGRAIDAVEAAAAS